MRRVSPPHAGSWTALAAAALLCSCVPEGPATLEGGSGGTPKPKATNRPKTTDTAAASARPPAPAPPARPPITAVFEDDFGRGELGPDWNALSPKWSIV